MSKLSQPACLMHTLIKRTTKTLKGCLQATFYIVKEFVWLPESQKTHLIASIVFLASLKRE